MSKNKLRNFMINALAGVIFMTSSIGSCYTAMADDGIKRASSPIKITVGNDSGSDYQSIQEALDSINVEPTQINNVTIFIKPGIYEEPVSVDKPYVSFKNASGTNAEDVVITYDRANGHIDSSKSFGTEKSATVTIGRSAVGFNAENITFQNSYNLSNDDGRTQVQAVALVSLADKVTFNNCRFIGRQDTLYLKGASKGQDVYNDVNSARVYLKDCYIEGTVDYIFGDATAYFDSCKLHIAKSASGNHFTAANTTLFNIGYVFNNCTLTVDKEYTAEDSGKIDLGRPWQAEDTYKNYGSHTVFLNCKMPKVLSEGLFKLWSESTVENKVRYYYYNLMDENGRPYDTSKAEGFVKELNEQQAQAYSLSNVLKGNDGWNPLGGSSVKGSSVVCDVTLNEYQISIPKYESTVLKAVVLPAEAENNNVKFESENEDIVSIDENGKITALKEGTAVVKAVTEENGFYAQSIVTVIKPRTAPPVVDTIKLSKEEAVENGDTLTLSYTYKLKSDEEIDAAEIRWFAVNPITDETVLLKEGSSYDSLSYTVSDSDVGYYIKAVVTPKTETTYGDKGETAEAVTLTPVIANSVSGAAAVYLKEGFDDFYDAKYQDSSSDYYPTQDGSSVKWIGYNSEGKVAWLESAKNGVSSIIPQCGETSDYSLIEYNPAANEGKWVNGGYEYRMRFNPEISGLNAEAYIDFYTDYNGKDNSYYKLRFTRGGNTSSLKAYLYRKAGSGSEEELIASDEKSLSGNAPQNSGENNPWFRIKQTNNNGNITVSFSLDNGTKLMEMSAEDSEPIGGGYTAIEIYGRSNAVILSNITVTGAKAKEDDSNKIRVYLAGDSTVKSYGDDDSIGGWGEFLPYYFDSSSVEIINKAEGGRSSRSFLNQGRLDEIMEEIRPGDYLFIQFGHNDALTTDTARVEHSVALGEPDENGIYPTNAAVKTETPPRIVDFYKDSDYPYSSTFYPYESGTFKWYLKQYVERAREKGAIPILITPVARVFFDDDGKIMPHHGENNGYVTAVIQLANELDCNFVNMFEITKTMYENYGVKVTQGLQNIKSDGSMDITHYNKFGSNIVTSLLIKALAEQNLPLANYTVASSRFVSKTEDLRNSTVYIVGDETAGAGDYDEDYKVMPAGWGKYFSEYFVSQITVKNLSVKGASSKSYIESDEYTEFINNIGEGDYVLLQFGLNDSLNDTEENRLNKYTKPGEDTETKNSFRWYLYNYYIKPAVEKKAVPYLITPVSDMDETQNGALKPYSDDIRELANEKMIAFINMYNESSELYGKLDEEDKNAMQAVYKDGEIDKRHLNEYGSRVITKSLIDMINFSSSTLKSYIDTSINIDDEYITKAEFMMLLADMMGIDGEAQTNFADVIKGKIYYDAIGNLRSLGIAKADADGSFNPEDAIDRNTAVEALKKALENGNNVDDDFDPDEFFSEGETAARADVHKAITAMSKYF